MNHGEELKRTSVLATLKMEGSFVEYRFVRDVFDELDKLRKPVDMLLFCPNCGLQHIDQPNHTIGWKNPPHRSHLCHQCGWIWRPADVATNGIVAITTKGKADSLAPVHAGLMPSHYTLSRLIQVGRRLIGRRNKDEGFTVLTIDMQELADILDPAAYADHGPDVSGPVVQVVTHVPRCRLPALPISGTVKATIASSAVTPRGAPTRCAANPR